MALWTIEHRMFAYDSFVKNNEVQREFRHWFNIHRNQAVPTRNTILCWVHVLRTRSSLINRRQVGDPRTVRTPENVELVGQALLLQFESLYSEAFYWTWILHEALHFHPYKLVIGNSWDPGDYAQQITFACQMEAIFEANDHFIL